jgi:hypothetical protein
MNKKIRPATINPELEAFLLQFGTVAKSDDAELIPEDSARCPRYKDRFLLQENAICRRKRNLALKRNRCRKAWASAEIARPTGTASLWYDWRTYKREDGWHLYVQRKTERRDALRVRRALASSEAKFAEEGR